MYTEEEARRLVADAGRLLVEKKLIARTWGNISAKIDADRFVITPSGRPYTSLEPEDMVIVHIDDLSYQGEVKPSSEKGVHAEGYKLRDDVDFIIHTHQFYASVIAAECRSVSAAPCAEYAMPGTGKLMKNVAAAIADNPEDKAFLLARHGALILGVDSDEAFALADKLEEDCKVLFENRVHDVNAYTYGKADSSRFRLRTNKFMTVVKDPYVMECCFNGLTLKPYLDDFAQIAGVDISCVPNKTVSIMRALRGRNAVLIEGVGALCTGNTQDDAEAVAQIVSKNCACACYVRRAMPLSRSDARLQRFVYTTKYSRLGAKNRKQDEGSDDGGIFRIGRSIVMRDPSGRAKEFRSSLGEFRESAGKKIKDTGSKYKEGLGTKITFRKF